MKNTIKMVILLTQILTIVVGQSQAGQIRFDNHLPGQFIQPFGGNVNDIIDKAIEARGGATGWGKIRQLTFTERYQVKNPNGQLLHRGVIEKRVLKDGNQFFSRSDDQSDATPAFIRCLGPKGFWMSRSALEIEDALLKKAYMFESTRDYLLFSMPYLIKRSDSIKKFAGVKPVHGKKCFQIYVPGINELKSFEGYEFLVSITTDTYFVKAISFWKEQNDQQKTTIYLSGYKPYKVPGRDLTQMIPNHYFIIFPDSSTLSTSCVNMELNKNMNRDYFFARTNINSDFPHNKVRETDLGSKVSLVRYLSTINFFGSSREQELLFRDERQRTEQIE